MDSSRLDESTTLTEIGPRADEYGDVAERANSFPSVQNVSGSEAEAVPGEPDDSSQGIDETADPVFNPVPTEAPSYPEILEPVPTVIEPIPTVLDPVPTVIEPISTETLLASDSLLPDSEEAKPEGSVWGMAEHEERDDADFDAVLGVEVPNDKPTVKSKPAKKRVPQDADVVRRPRRGIASGFATAVAGLVLAFGALTVVPPLLDPTPAGGAVQAGEQRATAQVQELNTDLDGYCHPTVAVANGFGTPEVLSLKLAELNTVCPVTVGESVTVYYEPGSGNDARYVRAGAIPVDLIMWSVFGIGFAVATWGALRLWGTWMRVRIPLVTPREKPPATLV